MKSDFYFNKFIWKINNYLACYADTVLFAGIDYFNLFLTTDCIIKRLLVYPLCIKNY